eukprot:CAMPEP_0197036614 /NCGR_PEP_ID=MMETSP1384-20130603/14077_1 /TAXON_ID=29189 /ORGANISM="Ammonia sp." /LENGTH=207 /DNA_ID=CAMNT_0042466811 /DNA_START=125 /DNA_END=748 /DNA_ORIENTATION=-
MIIAVLWVSISGIEERGAVFGPRTLPQIQAIIVIIFLTFAAILTVVYAPWTHQLSPWWFKILSITLYLGTLIWFYGEFYIAPHAGILPEGEWYSSNTQPVDFWSINHLLFGVLLGILYPFWAMMIVSIGWEMIEVFVYGDGQQGNINAMADIMIAIIGWWLVVLLFSRKCIPWISARYSVEQRQPKHYTESIDDDFETRGHQFSVYA